MTGYSDAQESRSSFTLFPSCPSSSSSLASGDLAWDIIDDLPLKWAKDYVPLTLAHSKLADGEAHKFELFRMDDELSNGLSVLAVTARNHIYIFESSRGERAFRFVQVSTRGSVMHYYSFARYRNSIPPPA